MPRAIQLYAKIPNFKNFYKINHRELGFETWDLRYGQLWFFFKTIESYFWILILWWHHMQPLYSKHCRTVRSKSTLSLKWAFRIRAMREFSIKYVTPPTTLLALFLVRFASNGGQSWQRRRNKAVLPMLRQEYSSKQRLASFWAVSTCYCLQLPR